MAPTEASILEQFLLAPAQLPTILSLDDFAALFRRDKASKKKTKETKDIPPAIRALYRDLQRQRGVVIDNVVADIAQELARGKLMRRYAQRARIRADAQEDVRADDELQIEALLRKTGGQGTVSAPWAPRGARSPRGARGSLVATVGELDAVVEDLEAEVARLEAEEDALLQNVRQAVGGLSDLRYGRLANTQLRDQVLEGLENVQATCDNLKKAG